MSDIVQYINQYFDTQQHVSDQLAPYFKPEFLARNELHTIAGSRTGKLSFVKSGFLRMYQQTDKKEVTQWISSPQEFVTDLRTLMFDQPAKNTIQALTDCELYSLNSEDYKKVQQNIPEWPKVEKAFLAKCFITIEDRVFSFLSMSSEERYQMLFQMKRELFQQVPQQYIASMLGMTPETFSRIRAKTIS